MADDNSKKRPRDILASLDAAFASTGAKSTPKYTSQAAQQNSAAVTQQAYQHSKHKKKRQQVQQQSLQSGKTNTQQAAPHQQKGLQQKAVVNEPLDALYGRLEVDVLRVGLKNCSLHDRISSLRKASGFHSTLKQYVASLAKDSNATAMTDKLKNKVLQFDNPIRTSDAAKRAGNEAQAQSAKLLSARQRRKLGLHLITVAIGYEEALQLADIWKRYAREIIGADFVGDSNDEAARSSRLVGKLRNIDLSGCPIEVIKSKNPSHIGASGIIIADKARVIQVCLHPMGKIITLPKEEVQLRVTLDEQRSFFLNGSLLLTRSSNRA